MPNQHFSQKNWSGGISDSDLLGYKGSVSEGVGIDIHSTPGAIKVSQALVKESGSTVTDFPKYGFQASDGTSYFFGDTGKIYRRTSAGAWSNPYIDSNGAILGAAEFDIGGTKYIFWATATKLGRQTTALALSESTWSSQNNAWQTLTSASFHPMQVLGLHLFIGNNRTVASVNDAGVFTTAGTVDVTLATLSSVQTIKVLGLFDIDLLVGTTITANFSHAKLLRWDTVSTDYSSPVTELKENGINALISIGNEYFIQAGSSGNIYYYNGATAERIKKIKGNYENKTMTVHPGAVCNFKSVPLFGVSNLSNNPCNEGIYSFTKHNRNYPIALMLEYVISQNKITAIEIGSMVAIGETLLVAWKDASTYGVDAISWSAKYGSAYFKTILVGGDRMLKKTYNNYVLGYLSKPASTDISIAYDKNYAGTFADTVSLVDQTNYNKLRGQENVDAGVMQFKISFTISANNSPVLEEVYIDWTEQPTI